jgi:hypothetical protein
VHPLPLFFCVHELQVFVIADFNNPDTYTEDHNNVLASAAFQVGMHETKSYELQEVALFSFFFFSLLFSSSCLAGSNCKTYPMIYAES